MGFKITKKGQVTIPSDLREQFNIVPGDELVFSGGDGFLKITKKINPKAFRASVGLLKKKGSKKTRDLLDKSRGKVDLP